jgi:hypothetical protein
MFKQYLLLSTSFSICTQSLLETSFPLIIHITEGFGKASTKHSNLTAESFLIGSWESMFFKNFGAPKDRITKFWWNVSWSK